MDIEPFQYFVDISWPFFVGAWAIRLACWVIGGGTYYLRRSIMGSPGGFHDDVESD